MMVTLRKEIMSMSDGETPTHVVFVFEDYDVSCARICDGVASGVLYAWDAPEIQPQLDREYDDGFGGADCPFTQAWTPTWAIVGHEYDGATSMRRVSRNPRVDAENGSGW